MTIMDGVVSLGFKALSSKTLKDLLRDIEAVRS